MCLNNLPLVLMFVTSNNSVDVIGELAFSEIEEDVITIVVTCL